jgi:hypothetical protein
MPIANVSEIVGRRDLVQEAQGWADIYLKRKELQMKQDKATEASKPKPYNFQLAEFGTNNENMLAVQEDLNDQVYNYAMANSSVLSIDYRSEDCGPDCKQAHKVLLNMQSAADIFNTYGDDLKSRYDALAELMVTDEDNYGNAENEQKLNDMINVWKQGMSGESFNFTFDNNGRLVVNSKKRKQVHKVKTDSTGNPILDNEGNQMKVYMGVDGEETTDPQKAAVDRNGEPIPIMAPVDTGQDTDFDNNQMGFSNWLTDLGFSDKVSNVGQGNFQKTVAEYENLIRRDTTGKAIDQLSYKALEAYIFGGGGHWDDNSGTGNTNGHSKYLKTLVRQEKGEDHIITKADIVDMAYRLGTGQGPTSSGSKSDTPRYNLPVQEISGFGYEHDLVYDDDKSFNVNQANQNPDYKTATNTNYVFEGAAYDTGEKGIITTKVDLNPDNITIIGGDTRFNQVVSDIQLDSYNQQVDFEGAQYGVSLFLDGKAISQEKYQSLTLEEKKRCSYREALYGNVKLPKSEAGKLDALGIKYSISGDNVLLKSIIPAEAYRYQIAGRGSGDRNDILISESEGRMNQLNKQLDCSLDFNSHEDCKNYVSDPNSGNSSSSNRSSVL